MRLHRAFGFHELPLLDPFLLLDDFRSENPADYLAGFPWHPHRGIETITYVLDGDVEHGDSLGNKGNISAGDIQWMTVGSGIIHQEMPKGNSRGQMMGFQLWANLPRKDKMTDPKYRGVTKAEIPIVTLENGTVIRVICGRVQEIEGPIQNVMINPEYLDVTIPAQKTFSHTVPKDHTVLAYVIDGEGYFDKIREPYEHDAVGNQYFDMIPPCACYNGTLVLFDSGTFIHVTTKHNAVRFLLISGKPLREPVAWYGPIVMNTHEELKQAFQEYEEGRFLKNQTS